MGKASIKSRGFHKQYTKYHYRAAFNSSDEKHYPSRSWEFKTIQNYNKIFKKVNKKLQRNSDRVIKRRMK